MTRGPIYYNDDSVNSVAQNMAQMNIQNQIAQARPTLAPMPAAKPVEMNYDRTNKSLTLDNVADLNKLKIESAVPHQLMQNPATPGKYMINLHPVPGERYTVGVTYGDAHVNGSPFELAPAPAAVKFSQDQNRVELTGIHKYEDLKIEAPTLQYSVLAHPEQDNAYIIEYQPQNQKHNLDLSYKGAKIGDGAYQLIPKGYNEQQPVVSAAVAPSVMFHQNKRELQLNNIEDLSKLKINAPSLQYEMFAHPSIPNAYTMKYNPTGAHNLDLHYNGQPIGEGLYQLNPAPHSPENCQVKNCEICAQKAAPRPIHTHTPNSQQQQMVPAQQMVQAGGQPKTGGQLVQGGQNTSQPPAMYANQLRQANPFDGQPIPHFLQNNGNGTTNPQNGQLVTAQNTARLPSARPQALNSAAQAQPTAATAQPAAVSDNVFFVNTPQPRPQQQLQQQPRYVPQQQPTYAPAQGMQPAAQMGQYVPVQQYANQQPQGNFGQAPRMYGFQ